MKIDEYKLGLGKSGMKMFDNLREKHQLKEDKDLLLLRIVAESWETMVSTREIINDPNSEGPKLHTMNTRCQAAVNVSIKASVVEDGVKNQTVLYDESKLPISPGH